MWASRRRWICRRRWCNSLLQRLFKQKNANGGKKRRKQQWENHIWFFGRAGFADNVGLPTGIGTRGDRDCIACVNSATDATNRDIRYFAMNDFVVLLSFISEVGARTSTSAMHDPGPNDARRHSFIGGQTARSFHFSEAKDRTHEGKKESGRDEERQGLSLVTQTIRRRCRSPIPSENLSRARQRARPKPPHARPFDLAILQHAGHRHAIFRHLLQPVAGEIGPAGVPNQHESAAL